MINVIVQGVQGCFHEEAARHYFKEDIAIVESNSFDILAKKLSTEKEADFAIMAIENSIAGSILQNYRILREYRFRIIGEIYLAIHHNLMALPGQSISDIKEICSHPMALNQCLVYLDDFPDKRLIETEDTALSAKRIRNGLLLEQAAIASKTAGEIYDLEILAPNIETSKVNYTRFFILQNDTKQIPLGAFNKASIYCRVPHQAGSLVKILDTLSKSNINLSKLQSYPVLGELNNYYFYMDLEFFKMDQYTEAISMLNEQTLELEVLGLYDKGLIVN